MSKLDTYIDVKHGPVNLVHGVLKWTTADGKVEIVRVPFSTYERLAMDMKNEIQRMKRTVKKFPASEVELTELGMDEDELY